MIENKIVVKVVALGAEIKRVRDCYMNILSGFVRRLTSLNVLFVKDVASLTKGMVITSRERFRQSPPHNFPRQKSGMVEGGSPAFSISFTNSSNLIHHCL